MNEKLQKALDLIVAERNRQNEKWGDQSENHPFEWMSILTEEVGELAQAINDTFFNYPHHGEHGGKDNIINEAVHVAAVATAIVEYISIMDI